jgi:hypothetical protein
VRCKRDLCGEKEGLVQEGLVPCKRVGAVQEGLVGCKRCLWGARGAGAVQEGLVGCMGG